MIQIKKFENFDSHGMGTLSGMDHPGSLAGWEKNSDSSNPNKHLYFRIDQLMEFLQDYKQKLDSEDYNDEITDVVDGMWQDFLIWKHQIQENK